jgi:hypothetical protein
MSSEEEYSDEERPESERSEDDEPKYDDDEGQPGFKETEHTTREEAKGKTDAYDIFFSKLEDELKKYVCFKHIKSGDDNLSDLKTRIKLLPNVLLLNIPLLALAVCFEHTHKGLVNNKNISEFIGNYGGKNQDYDAIDIIRYVRFYSHYNSLY